MSLLSIIIFFPTLRIRVPYPFQWGAPSFNAGEAFAMMAASLVGLVEVGTWFFWFGLLLNMDFDGVLF